MKLLAISFVLAATAGIASADGPLHVSTDIVTWDKAQTEAQCLAKAKTALASVAPGFTQVAAQHAYIATSGPWVLAVDCLQSYKLNGAYVTLVYNGTDTAAWDKRKLGLSKALGGKSELYK